MFRMDFAEGYKYSHDVGGDPYEMLKLQFGRQYTKEEVESAFRRAAHGVHPDTCKRDKDTGPFIRLTKAKQFLTADPKGLLGGKFRTYYNIRAAGEKASREQKIIKAKMERLKKGSVTWAPNIFVKRMATPRKAAAAPAEERKVPPEKAVIPTEEPQIEREKKQTTRIQKENTDPDPDRKTPVSPKKKKGEERKKKVKTLALEIEKMTTNLGVMADQLGVLKTKILELEAE